MSIRTTISAVAVALAALLLVALAPTGAAAHGGVPHAPAAKYVVDNGAVVSAAAVPMPAELRAQNPVPADHQTNTDCGDRGCCAAGHCSGCATAIAPATWTCLRPASNVLLLSPDAALPTGLARAGPPRPPKSFA